MSSDSIQFRAISGARTEEGLCYLLEIGETSILLDCGSYDDYNEERLRALKRIARNVDALLLSHPDLAHVGAYPLAYKEYGLRCPVYSTIPVQNMGRLCMTDLVRSKRLAEDFELFSVADVNEAFEHITPLRYSQPIVVPTKSGAGDDSDVVVTAFSAGHSIGGSVWTIQKDTETVLYAVDFNHVKEQHLSSTALLTRGGRVAESMTRPTVLITDAYNALVQVPRRKERDSQLIDMIRKTTKEGGNVLIPTDTSARVLELAYQLENAALGESTRVAVVGRCARQVMKYAQSSLEWMADSIGHKFDQTRTNPFDFRRVKLLQMRKEVEELVASTAASDGSGVAMLASFSSLETGHSREWLYEWARNEKNLVILTQRGPPGSLSRLLYEQWMAGLGSDSDEPNATVADRQGVTKLPLRKPERLDDLEVQFQIKRRVALEGRELEAWKLAEKNRREQENALMQRNHLMMIGDEDEYDDDDYMGDGVRSEDSDMEVELGNVKRNAAKAAMSSIGEMKSAGGVLPVAVTDAGDYRAAQNRKGRGLGGNSKMGSMFGVTEMDLEIDSLLTGKAFDLYVRDYNDPVLGAGEAGDGSFLMYPYIQRTRRADDYGELIDPLVYIQDSNERENDQEKEEEEVEGTDKTRAKRSGDSMILDGGEVIEDIEDELDDEYDPNIPSKYLSDTQTLKFDCRLAYVDYDGRVDSKAIGNIITLIAPHRLVLVHGSNDATEHLYQSCLANDQMTNQIFAPSNDEIVNVSSGSNTFTVKLTDNILNTMLMAAGFSTTVQGYDLAYMCGRLEYIEDSKVPVLNAPPSDVRGRWRDPLVVGSTKLTELKRALKANDIDSEFRGDGVLVCSNGNVAIQRTKDGKLKIQSNLSPLYYRVRDIIYNQVAVL